MVIFFASLLILSVLIIAFLIDSIGKLENKLEIKHQHQQILFDTIREKYGIDGYNKIFLDYMHKILPPPMEEIKDTQDV